METEIRNALQKVEEDRACVTNTPAQSLQAILSMGPVQYVTKHLTDTLRHLAHNYAMEAQSKPHTTFQTRKPTNPQSTEAATTHQTFTAEPQEPGITKELQGDYNDLGHKLEMKELREAYQVVWLHFFKVQKYIDEVNLHIRKLQEIGRILFPDDGELHDRFRDHDCSKFEYDEVYGYVLKWTHGQECDEWQLALDHHLQNNDHHPEYYSGRVMDGLALVESVVDMLSWRWIKNRETFPVNSPWLFDIEDKYLDRYEATDREKVRTMLEEWKRKDMDLDSLGR